MPETTKKDSPVLAVTLDSAFLHCLLRVPASMPGNDSGEERATEYVFSLPSPERILRDRITRVTAMRRPLFINCAVVASICVDTIAAHLAAGLPLILHPETAAFLGLDANEREARGITLAPACPDPAESVLGPSFSTVALRSLLAMACLPQPGAILVSALERGPCVFHGGNEAERRSRAAFGVSLFSLSRHGGRNAASLLYSPFPPEMLRLRAIQRMTGNAVTDSSVAFVLALLALPGMTERSYRQGIVLLFAGKHVLSATLVFQGRVFGFFELPRSAVLPSDGKADPQLLPRILDDFRLGWFPGELAAKLGGFVDVAPSLPPEAEGFRPVFVAGPQAALLAGQGQILALPGGLALQSCCGLLHAYESLRRGCSGGESRLWKPDE